MAKGLHRVTLRISSRLDALSPSETTGMKGHPVDPETPTPLIELGRPVRGSHSPQVGKEGARPRQAGKDFGHLIAEMQQSSLICLLATVADHPFIPVDVFGNEICDVAPGILPGATAIGNRSAALGHPGLGLDDGFHGELPSPSSDRRVACRKVGTRQLEVEDRLFLGLIPCLEEALGGGAVLRAQALLAEGNGVFDVEDAADSWRGGRGENAFSSAGAFLG